MGESVCAATRAGWRKPPHAVVADSLQKRGLRNKEEGFLSVYLLCICLIQQLLEKKKST